MKIALDWMNTDRKKWMVSLKKQAGYIGYVRKSGELWAYQLNGEKVWAHGYISRSDAGQALAKAHAERGGKPGEEE